jgi:hypothetical protein
VALCGSWDHDGPCRWPHHNDLDSSSSPARLRTVVVADDASRPDVVARIEHALRADERWSVASCTTGPPTAGERPLAERLGR